MHIYIYLLDFDQKIDHRSYGKGFLPLLSAALYIYVYIYIYIFKEKNKDRLNRSLVFSLKKYCSVKNYVELSTRKI